VPPTVDLDEQALERAAGGVDPGLLLQGLRAAHRHRSEIRMLLNVYDRREMKGALEAAPRILLHFVADAEQRDEERSIP
jgi:hypothetical protein